MTIAIKVCRGGSSLLDCLADDPLLNWGDDIQDVLLCTEDAARERGRVEIDENHENKIEVEGALPIMEYIDPESIVRLGDLQGRLISLELNANMNTRRTTIKIESKL